MEQISLKWTHNAEFELSSHENCSKLNPKALMLYAAGLCAGRTVAMLISKMEGQFSDMNIEVQGELSQTAATSQNVFTSIDYRFEVECDDPKDHIKISRAIELAHSKYCGVTRMMKMIAPVSFDIYIHSAQEAQV